MAANILKHRAVCLHGRPHADSSEAATWPAGPIAGGPPSPQGVLGGLSPRRNTPQGSRPGMGARGIDYMDNPAPSGGCVAFPMYDAHGNMVATLARGVNGAYTVGNVRSFDAWGLVRFGSETGRPDGALLRQSGPQARRRVRANLHAGPLLRAR